MEHDWPGNVSELAHFAERVSLGLDEPHGTTPEPDLCGLAHRVEAFERELIEDALRRLEGDVTATAEMLRIPRKTLYDKFQRHGLRPADFRSPQ